MRTDVLEQRVRYALLCAIHAGAADPAWIAWALHWMDGMDRSEGAAREAEAALDRPWRARGVPPMAYETLRAASYATYAAMMAARAAQYPAPADAWAEAREVQAASRSAARAAEAWAAGWMSADAARGAWVAWPARRAAQVVAAVGLDLAAIAVEAMQG